MIDQLESDYNCANASSDMHELKQSIASLASRDSLTDEERDTLNRLENQLHFIKTKCGIHNG